MLRRSVATLVAFFFIASALLAADKTVKGTLVKVDIKKQQLVLKTDDSKKRTRSMPKPSSSDPRGASATRGSRMIA